MEENIKKEIRARSTTLIITVNMSTSYSIPSIYILIYVYYSFSPHNLITCHPNFIDEKSEANTCYNKASV